MEESSWPVLAGRSCTLAALSIADAPDWLAGEDAEIVRWFEFPRPSRLEDATRAIASWRESWLSDGPVRQWGIWHDDRLAGGIDLRDRGDRRANLSYVVFAPHRRRGLAREAVGLATSWALGHLPVDAVVAWSTSTTTPREPRSRGPASCPRAWLSDGSTTSPGRR